MPASPRFWVLCLYLQLLWSLAHLPLPELDILQLLCVQRYHLRLQLACCENWVEEAFLNCPSLQARCKDLHLATFVASLLWFFALFSAFLPRLPVHLQTFSATKAIAGGNGALDSS